jgi:hypothetical protein
MRDEMARICKPKKSNTKKILYLEGFAAFSQQNNSEWERKIEKERERERRKFTFSYPLTGLDNKVGQSWIPGENFSLMNLSCYFRNSFPLVQSHHQSSCKRYRKWETVGVWRNMILTCLVSVTTWKMTRKRKYSKTTNYKNWTRESSDYIRNQVQEYLKR